MIPPALQLRNVSKSFGALRVTNDLSLMISAGMRHGLIGPNGAGKTTLVNMISGLLRPSVGTIELSGVDVTQTPPERRVAMGLARTFQITSLFPLLTVVENVAIALMARNGADRRVSGRLQDHPEVIDELCELLEPLGLMDYAQRRICELPYGIRRLVELALVLAVRPKVLLLDEPAAGLSSTDRVKLLDLLLKLPKHLTVFIIEHDMSLLFRLVDRITVMVEGRVLTEGTVAETRANKLVRDVYLGARHRG